MSKKDFKDRRNIIILEIIFIIIVLILTRFHYLYGSIVDWQTQHWTFAEYFRNLFYSTKQLFPSFALNIGAGQNIYNFSYYGLFNPLILLSYLFPFIKMADYVMIISIISVMVSIILLYKWLRSHDFSSTISFFGTFIFLCSAPLILHSHRHIMFVNYFPFLIWALFSVDKYFKENKRTSLIISTFLIVMTSYYYSIGSIIVIAIYGLYVYLRKTDKVTIKNLIKEAIKFLLPIIIGIFLAGVLIFPTLHTLLNGRVDTTQVLNLTSFLPKVHLEYYLYSSYSLGLTSICIIALIYAIASKDKAKRCLGIILSLFGITSLFIYILNGLLYSNAKVLIPFIPLFIYLIASYIKDIDKVNLIKIIIIFLIVSILAFLTGFDNYYYLIDMILLIIALLLYHFKKNKIMLYAYLIIAPLTVCLIVNFNDNLMAKESYNDIYNDSVQELLDSNLNKEDNIYRSSNMIDALITTNKVYDVDNYYTTSLYSSAYNADYANFYTNIFNNPISYRNYLINSSPRNVLWQIFMGVKYVVSTNDVGIGYQLVDEAGKYKLYKNENVLPIGYVRSSLMSTTEFNNLEYPYNIEALMHYTIIDKDVDSGFTSNIKEYNIDYSNVETSLNIKKKDNHYLVEAKEDTSFTINLNEPLNNQLLFIRFNMNYEQSCHDGDTSITINGIKNTLTCSSWKYKNENKTFDYVVSSNESLNKLKVKFKKGTYDISDIKLYILDYETLINDNINEFVFDKEKTKGDDIVGHIKVLEDGYFTLSIPYDTGFKILVNNEEISYEKVNTAFIGFSLDKGEYEIKIKYTAPLRNFGLIVSGCSVVVTIIIGIIDKKRGKKNEKRKN